MTTGSLISSIPTTQRRLSKTSLVLIAVLFGDVFSMLHLLNTRQEVVYWELIAIIGLGAVAACFAIRADRSAEASSIDAHGESQLAYLADFATDLFWETDLDGMVVAVGGRLMSTLTPDSSELIGCHYLDVVHLEDDEMVKMLEALDRQSPYSDIESTFYDPSGESYFISLSATPHYGPDGEIRGYLGVGTNVTDRVRNQRKLRHLAEHDMLTGLSNRYAFTARIEKDLKASSEEACLALLAIDLDGFKAINDTYGHQAGDALLNLVAKRLKTKTRDTDWAARLGGDEFVVVSRYLANPIEACLVAARLTDALSRPYRIGGLELVAKASIGIAVAPVHARKVEALMKRADEALYQAKADGRGCYRLYETGLLVSAT